MRRSERSAGRVRHRFGELTLVLASAMLPGCDRITPQTTPVPPSDVGNKTGANAATPLYPESLQGMKSLELGELILLLMPSQELTSVGWDFNANAPVQWQKTAYSEESTGYAYRTGWARVNLLGRTATVLRDQKDELGWTITYSNDTHVRVAAHAEYRPAKFGISKIDIRPGGEGDASCFGTAFEGCDFEEPFESLVKAGIQMGTICSQSVAGGGHLTAWLLTRSGHRPTVMTWTQSSGSGGSTSWLTLRLDDKDLLPQWATARDKATPDLYDSQLCGE